MRKEQFAELRSGGLYAFASWPNSLVPKFGAGVCTIWHKDGRFLYVGMSGKKIKADVTPDKKMQGLYTRLHSHFTGKRSGDQFCVYVADRLVLPTLSQEDIVAIAAGRPMDVFVRLYIHDNLMYRFILFLALRPEPLR
jgi:hypothetical protein